MEQDVLISKVQELLDRLRVTNVRIERKGQKYIAVDNLQEFFNQLSKLQSRMSISGNKQDVIKPDGFSTSIFFEKLKDPLHESVKRGVLCNPWDIARIKRDERTNVGILAWLLDPAGDHGLEDCLLRSFLELINQSKENIFLLQADSKIFVGLEYQCDDNGSTKRIDLIIKNYSETKPFVLGIEAKIDSREHSNQTQSYLNFIRELSLNDSYHLIFLTSKGEQANVEVTQIDNTTSMTWEKLSYKMINAIRKLERQSSGCNFSLRLAELFFRHTLTF